MDNATVNQPAPSPMANEYFSRGANDAAAIMMRLPNLSATMLRGFAEVARLGVAVETFHGGHRNAYCAGFLQACSLPLPDPTEQS